MATETVKTRVIFDELAASADGVLHVYFHKSLHRADAKSIGAAAIVKDQNLIERLNRLEIGNEIEIEIVTDWNADGAPMILVAFCEINNMPGKTVNGNGNGKPKAKEQTDELTEEYAAV